MRAANKVGPLDHPRAEAEKFLKDTVGCLILQTSLPHVRRAIADEIQMAYSSSDRRSLVTVNAYDLTHILAELQFRYQGAGDFPVTLLRFKPRMQPEGHVTEVFRQDEYLMRAGIVLQLQSDNTKVRIETGPQETSPPFVLDYKEESIILTVGETSLSKIATGFMVGVNLGTGTVFGNFGVKFT